MADDVLTPRYLRTIPEWDALPEGGFVLGYDPTAPAGRRIGRLPVAKLHGRVGPQGPPGPQGLRGIEGPPGDRGLVGDKGSQGDPGIPGAAGVRGPEGNKGSTGDQGAKGLPGDKGMTGDKGPTGDAGPASIIVPSGGKDGDLLVKKGSTLIWRSPTVSIWLG